MSLDVAPLLRKKQNFAFALETTTSTAASLSGTNGVTPVFNPKIDFSTEIVARESQGTLSPSRQGLGAQSAEGSFETELFNAASAPYWTALFSACGLQNNSGVWTPLDNAQATMTLGHYINGRLRSMIGSMGSFKMMFKRGQAVRIQWAFKGIPNGAPSSASISPTIVTVVAPLCGQAAMTIGGTTYRFDELTFDAGNEVILREDDSSPSGYRAAYITNRTPTVTVAPEALLSKNWDADFIASNTAALSVPVGVGTNNVWTLGAPNMQLKKDPKDGERQGMLTDELEFLCTSTTAGGQDEYSLTAS